MNIILVGYGQMLSSLIEGIEKLDKNDFKIAGVFRTDRVKYSKFGLFFKDIFNQSQDYSFIKNKKLYDIKGTGVNSREFINEIKKLKADIILVGSWGEKFKNEILNTIPCVNFHPALLPKNRGANPYFWSIYLNQKVTGLTIHFMNEKFDKGDIILQEAIMIDENENGKSLKNKTTALAKLMVQDFLKLYKNKQIQPIKQDEKFASYEYQISEKELVIDLNKDKDFVSRHLRALYPWATPYVLLGSRYVEVKKPIFLELSEENKKEKNYKIVQKDKKSFTLKGSNFLLKINK